MYVTPLVPGGLGNAVDVRVKIRIWHALTHVLVGGRNVEQS